MTVFFFFIEEWANTDAGGEFHTLVLIKMTPGRSPIGAGLVKDMDTKKLD